MGGILGALSGILGPGLTTATEAVGAHDNTAYQAALTQRNQAIQAALLARQMRMEANMEQYRNAMGYAAYQRGNLAGAKTSWGPPGVTPKTMIGQDDKLYEYDRSSDTWHEGTVGPPGPTPPTRGQQPGGQPISAPPPGQAPGRLPGAAPNTPGGAFKPRVPPPQPDYGPPVQGEGPNGPSLFRPNRRGPGMVDTGVPAVPRAGLTGSLPQDIRDRMMAQAIAADKLMTAYEKKYMAQQGGGTGGVMSHIFGAAQRLPGKDLTSGVAQAFGNTAEGYWDPEYQTYLNAQQRFGNIMGNLMSRRYTEYQGQLDTQLVGLGSNDVEPTIALKQGFRRDLVGRLQRGEYEPPGGKGPGGPTEGAAQAPTTALPTSGATTGSPSGTGSATPASAPSGGKDWQKLIGGGVKP